MAQTLQIYRTNTNTPPGPLLPGVLSAELGSITKLWIGSSTGNRLLLPVVPGLLDVLVLTGTASLAGNCVGLVCVENATTAAVTVTLPPTPSIGQKITVKDGNGTAGTYPITIAGGGHNIDGVASIPLIYAYSWVDLVYTGAYWVQV